MTDAELLEELGRQFEENGAVPFSAQLPYGPQSESSLAACLWSQVQPFRQPANSPRQASQELRNREKRLTITPTQPIAILLTSRTPWNRWRNGREGGFSST
jgi:hypothetical protein